MMRKKNIILTGYRASGKSLLGSLLAQALNLPFLDTDHILTRRLRGAIQEIVQQHGWDFFRKEECALLTELSAMKGIVAATGGGAIQHQEAWKHLRDCSHIIWLDADPATLCLRMQNDSRTKTQRPSLTGKSSLAEIEEVLADRRPLYAAGSDLRLDSGTKDPHEVLDDLLDYLRRQAFF